MKKQTIIWTALPNGMIIAPELGGARLRLSVFVTPRLQTNESLPRPKLSQFPDFLDWPAEVAQMQFRVQFGNMPSVPAERVDPESDPAPSALWGAMFDANTYVKPFEFPETERTVVHSYSVKNVVAHLKTAYQSLAIETPHEPPKLPLGDGGVIDPRVRPFVDLLNGASPPAPETRQLNQQFDRHLRSAQFKAIANPTVMAAGAGRIKARRAAPRGAAVAVPASMPQVAVDFHQLKNFHGRVEYVGRVPRPKVRAVIPVPEMDFHEIVSSLGEYPLLMRRLGLVIDLEVPLTTRMRSAQWVKVIPVWDPSLSTTTDATPRTRCKVTAKDFVALPKSAGGDTANGMLKLDDEDRFEVGQIDVDGAAIKTVDLAENLRQGRGETEATAPAVRSAGIWVAKVNQAHDFSAVVMPRLKSLNLTVQKVQTSQVLNGRPTAAARGVARRVTPTRREPDVELYAEDLVRGYRIDVWDEADGAWRSLCERIGEYKFDNLGQTIGLADEGCISLAATSDVSGESDDLYMHETLFRWEGWSLCASRPGMPVPQQGVATATTNDYGLQVVFTAKPRSLPRLRFGHEYRIRARVADLAGNGLVLDDPAADQASEPVTYVRHEPLASPTIVPRKNLADARGESVERVVIHSFNDAPPKDAVPTTETSQRHVVPPRTSQIMAETHGMFDLPQGVDGSPDVYSMIISKDEALAEFYDTDAFELPYLPDPIALGALVRIRSLKSAAGEAMETVRVPFGEDWPNLQPFRIVVVERTPARNQATFDAAARALYLPLEKAETAEVWVSTYMSPENLAKMGMWHWTVDGVTRPAIQARPLARPVLRQVQRDMPHIERLPQVRARIGLNAVQTNLIQKLNVQAVQGVHWMITPNRKLTLVHAVQQPLVVPQFQSLKATKRIGDTFARISDAIPIDGNSTAKVDILAEWNEPVDQLAEPEPAIIHGQQYVFDVPVEPDVTQVRLDEPARLAQIRRETRPTVRRAPSARPALKPSSMVAQLPRVGRPHEFGDTKHRRVTYEAVATTRFREYLPFTDEDIESGDVQITRASDKVTVDVLNSARPAAPQVLYVVPTFGWNREQRGNRLVSERKGGGLRVYMERPWFSSGEGELLGVVLPKPVTLSIAAMPGVTNVAVQSYVTMWGQDPLWRSGPTSAMLTPSDFPGAVTSEDNLTLDELEGARVRVAGHEVGYDPERQLWYCDIEIDPRRAYFPFVRMALARYQPKSVRTSKTDVKLSRVVLADFAQLAPNRLASISSDPADGRVLNVSVSGQSYNISKVAQANVVEVTLEGRRGNVEGDLGWTPLQDGTVELKHMRTRSSTLWRGKVTLPTARGSRPYRLVIKEYEVLQTDTTVAVMGRGRLMATERRLVYADVIKL